MKYGKPPVLLGDFQTLSLPEVMYYLYLPVAMPWYDGQLSDVRLPPALECCRPLIDRAMTAQERKFRYVYLSARKGWATPDNPLNRPGWHCDGFGTDDLNFIWWKGPSTRFATGDFGEISENHLISMDQFTKRIEQDRFDKAVGVIKSNAIKIENPPAGFLYGLDPYVVHATPVLNKGCMRQFIKISLSDHKYNLYNNSHNYLFDYEWEMVDREETRNDTTAAQRDYK